MTTHTTSDWYEANQRYLTASLALVRQALHRHAVGPTGTRGVEFDGSASSDALHLELQQASARMPGPAALDTLSAAFILSPFERDILLMCAGIELDAGFAALCADAQGDARRPYPTFGLALAALPEAHWSAIAPSASLRRWRLIEMSPGPALTTSPLRIDERVLHYLTGVPAVDEGLQGFLQPLPVQPDLPPSQQALAETIVRLWSGGGGLAARPVVQLCGDGLASAQAIGAAACAALGVTLQVVRATDIPMAVAEREALRYLWEREAVLSQSALLVDCTGVEGLEPLRPALTFLERSQGLLLVASREPLGIQGRLSMRLDVSKPSHPEQQQLWQRALGPVAQSLNGDIGVIVSQFHLDPPTIYAASAEVLAARGHAPGEPYEDSRRLPRDTARALWDACRVHARPRLDALAQRIDSTSTWDDLVLPELQRQTLYDITTHVRQRSRVYDGWGFAAKSRRGLGISALFAGASGTGKTMAAEVLAHELRLDLYRIDLSQVVSKYIGETEKNLRHIFDAAEDGGAILLFDEADALFGKRSEVKDSHDRYANIEVSYLLQRMEEYHGLAILTTNMKSALDPAFLRRLRFIVSFPFPDAAQRLDIWRRIFPAQTPIADLDWQQLSRLNVAGGSIRNIALNAAFLAADAGEPVRMTHLLRAAQGEYAKLEKPLTEAEIAGWR